MNRRRYALPLFVCAALVVLAGVLVVLNVLQGGSPKILSASPALCFAPVLLLGLVPPFFINRRRIKEAECTQKKFRALVEATPDGIVFARAGGPILLVNTQVELLLGCTAQDLIGKSVE